MWLGIVVSICYVRLSVERYVKSVTDKYVENGCVMCA
jgi:hypothetical protein